MPEYRPTIGIEVHAELKTATKLFCSSANDPLETRPNVNICPICMGHPGTLPVMNRAAVRHMLRIGAAVGGQLADFTEWDRKNYFYPDLPKGYQITQYAYPLVSGGELAGVALTRIHLEEDTARSQHDASGASLVDYNRAGVPLMELVTEPVVRSAEEAGRFARELQLLLRYLDASDADMERGQMRVEANISISSDPAVFGTKVEIKNLNSFRAMEAAVAYEIKRQAALLDHGERVLQETRGWNEVKGETYAQRSKESANDYRYFPEPDLPKLKISEIEEFRDIAATLPELPWQRRGRYEAAGLARAAADFLVANRLAGDYFDAAVAGLASPRAVELAANYVRSDLAALFGGDFATPPLSPESFREVVVMLEAGELSSRGGKDLLALLIREGGDPRAVAAAAGLVQTADPDLLARVAGEVITAHASVAAEYRAGKTVALQFLVGQGMKLGKGALHPGALREELSKQLS